METQLIVALLPAAVAFAAGWLAKRHVVSKGTLDQLATYTRWAVLSAEEAHRDMPDSGQAKLDHATNAVLDHFHITPEEASTIVHSTVNILRQSGILGPKHDDAPKGPTAVMNDPFTS